MQGPCRTDLWNGLGQVGRDMRRCLFSLLRLSSECITFVRFCCCFSSISYSLEKHSVADKSKSHLLSVTVCSLARLGYFALSR
jgi:hypothetical protein